MMEHAMENTKHLHDQIARATARLAQLQARDLVARQQREAREREARRKREAQQRHHLGQLVIAAGGEDLADGEIVAALLNYKAGHQGADMRSRAKVQGDAHLAAVAADSPRRKHESS